MHSHTARRLLLSCLVLACVVNVGCTTLDQQCGMRADYVESQRVAPTGRVVLAWAYEQGFPDSRYGEAIIADEEVIIRMAGQPPSFNDICALARLGHEAAHGMKGRHQ